MSPKHDFSALRNMRDPAIQVNVATSAMISDSYQWTFQITNNSKQLLFFINPQLMSGDEEVLPSFWSDNYFSIPAGESKIVALRCAADKLNGASPFLKVEGWNIKETRFSLSHAAGKQ